MPALSLAVIVILTSVVPDAFIICSASSLDKVILFPLSVVLLTAAFASLTLPPDISVTIVVTLPSGFVIVLFIDVSCTDTGEGVVKTGISGTETGAGVLVGLIPLFSVLGVLVGLIPLFPVPGTLVALLPGELSVVFSSVVPVSPPGVFTTAPHIDPVFPPVITASILPILADTISVLNI